MRAIALSTVDNPYNPFKQFNEWLAFDNEFDYNCCGILARLAVTTNDLMPQEVNKIIEKAVDDFVFADPIGLYCKVVDE